MTTKGLKGCPFCGDKPEKRWNDDNLDFIHCSNQDCDLYGAEIYEDYWNTRASDELIDKLVEALEYGERHSRNRFPYLTVMPPINTLAVFSKKAAEALALVDEWRGK